MLFEDNSTACAQSGVQMSLAQTIATKTHVKS